MRKAGSTLTILIAAIIIAAGLCLHIDRIAVLVLSRAANIEVSYENAKRLSFGRFDFKNLRISDSRRGIGLSAEEADIRISPAAGMRGAEIIFSMKGVSFTGKSAGDPSYGDIEGLVLSAFSQTLKYRTLTGSVTATGGGIAVRGLEARGDDMRLALSGTLNDKNDISADCVIYFSSSLRRKIPREISDVILKEDPTGWSSLTVHIAGNYKAPAISVTSRLFRLNIREMSAQN